VVLKKESKGKHKVIELISKFLYNKNMTPSTIQVHVHYMNLMKNQILQNFQSLEILKERATRQRIHFLNHLTKILCSMDSKCLGFRHKSYVEKINTKKHVWLSIETHFEIFYFSNYKPKY
jgi:hypothetical protein